MKTNEILSMLMDLNIKMQQSGYDSEFKIVLTDNDYFKLISESSGNVIPTSKVDDGTFTLYSYGGKIEICRNITKKEKFNKDLNELLTINQTQENT